jgi:hypothetical protein
MVESQMKEQNLLVEAQAHHAQVVESIPNESRTLFLAEAERQVDKAAQLGHFPIDISAAERLSLVTSYLEIRTRARSEKDAFDLFTLQEGMLQADGVSIAERKGDAIVVKGGFKEGQFMTVFLQNDNNTILNVFYGNAEAVQVVHQRMEEAFGTKVAKDLLPVLSNTLHVSTVREEMPSMVSAVDLVKTVTAEAYQEMLRRLRQFLAEMDRKLANATRLPNLQLALNNLLRSLEAPLNEEQRIYLMQWFGIRFLSPTTALPAKY